MAAAASPSRSPEVVEMQGIRVLFLNTHLFKGTTMAALYRPIQYRDCTRADAIAQMISTSGASVVMLAEVWGASSRDRIIRGVADTHKYFWAPPRKPHGPAFKLGTGLLFLSTMPIENCHCSWFNELSGWDDWSQKGVASARIDGVTYSCSHIDAGDGSCRASNLRELFTHLETYVADDSAVVFAGDMNISESNAGEFSPMAEGFATRARLYDPLRALHPDLQEFPAITMDHAVNGLACYWSGLADKSRSRLDYFFVRGITPLECTVADGYCHTLASHGQMQLTTVAAAPIDPPLPLSDHWPISLVFRK